MPYTFSKMEVTMAKHVYLPLNRNYKPLGLTTREWVQHEPYLHQAVVFSSDPHDIQGVWWTKVMPSKPLLTLYNDDPESRFDYFSRLERLMSRSVRLAQFTRVAASEQSRPRPLSNAPRPIGEVTIAMPEPREA
jgi:hypothetical protein